MGKGDAKKHELPEMDKEELPPVAISVQGSGGLFRGCTPRQRACYRFIAA